MYYLSLAGRTIFVCLALSTSAAVAVPIPIVNSGFETATLPITWGDALGNNVFSGNGTLAGWTPVGPTNNTVYGGALQITLFGGFPDWTNTWWSGQNIGYLQPFGSTTPFWLEQTVAATLESDTVYDLSLLVGRRLLDFGGPNFVYDVQLLAGSTVLASGNQLNLTVDSAGVHTLSYDSGSANPLAGQALSIRLMATTNEVFFDDVSLNAQATPEPGAVGMVLAGLGTLASRMRRRQRQAS